MSHRRGTRRETQLAFEALSIEGGLLSPEWLTKVAQLQAGAQAEADYRIHKGLNLRDEIGRYWRIAQAHWADFKSGRDVIQWRGRRRSVALNSLRLVLFDLAAMFCAVEGTSSAPAFLLHDSPREGDLDPWTYARLFQTALALGSDEQTAPFQYIVTTTTEPPPGDVRQRVRVELSARVDESRFFRVDL